ncbi:MAG: hypothetical protein M1825_003308 [Sarcosagium campestre]|nr:MAG: hypothetical protein M1825_003308 [Sarcosagium campestre]
MLIQTDTRSFHKTRDYYSQFLAYQDPLANDVGKTTLATTLATRLNALYAAERRRQQQQQQQQTTQSSPSSPTHNEGDIAVFLPMDGYHLSRAQLSAMPDPATAHARRGAEFTFDGDAFLTLIQALRQPLRPTTSTLYGPSFDHATKDPVAEDIAIAADARIVVCEGNYLSLDKSPWSDAAALMDELWFVEVEREVARKRLVERHLRTGVAPNEQEADKRARENDLVNGDEILANRLSTVGEFIVSREDQRWAPRSEDGVGTRPINT